MQWNIPGTVIPVDLAQDPHIEDRIRGMFLGGGMMLGQITAVTGLEPYTVQNWVKRGFLTAPVNKRYTLRQLCRIININMLKDVLAMEDICGLLQYINGHLDDESDDLIDDSKLYFLFIRLTECHVRTHTPFEEDVYLNEVLLSYEEPIPGAKQRVAKVLRIMLTAWAAAQMKHKAQLMLADIKKN
ncbi:MAG: DUF1836 domain-containing protein [Oscillospiraceae bacterium]|nr:DUF1836 domain-containing protein [Oscillospiraceae bacterium]